MTRIVLVLLALLCTTHIAMAQCGAPSYGTATYATPYKEVVVKKEVHEIVVPIAVPVIVPATVFQYLPALAPAAIPVASAEVGVAAGGVGVAAGGVGVAAGGVAAAPAAPVASVPAPSVAVPSTPAPMTEADIDRVIRERVEAILNERQSGDKGPPKLVLPDEVKDTLTPPPKTPPPTAAKGSLDQQVASLLGSQSCTRCHTAGETPVKGNVTLFVKKGKQLFFQPSVPKDRIVAALTPDQSTGKSAMPPDGTAQSPASADLLRRWVATR